MSTPAVQLLCLNVWAEREDGTLPRKDMVLSRRMVLAAAKDVLENDGYDPEMDRRVEWLREVIRQRRMLRPHLRPEASGDLEALMEWVLFDRREVERCGKMAAAGEEVGA